MFSINKWGQPILLSVFAVILVSCAQAPITMDRAQTIERGIPYEEFKSLITRKPTSAFSIEYKGVSYSIEIYPMQTGTRTQLIYVPSVSGGGYFTPTPVPVHEDYVFIFDKGGLIYRGFLNVCHKAEDKLVQRLAPLIAKQYDVHFLD